MDQQRPGRAEPVLLVAAGWWQHGRDTRSSPWAVQWILSSPSPSHTIQFGAVPAVLQDGHGERAGTGLRKHTASGPSSVLALKGESSRDISKSGISRTKTYSHPPRAAVGLL